MTAGRCMAKPERARCAVPTRVRGLQPQDRLWEVSGDASGQDWTLYGAGHRQLWVQPELSGSRKGQPGRYLPGLAEGRDNSS
ncbi:hypothetical protein I79_006454 [Cricetulus griseus]|uniref:Uncharacterized protein n=1 Tax=Cricetulus griseus TaxID=10029 RepID=G3H7W0_CRIGR|nr:hypothetical protein I79_006454 [Cricetulus griseus]ERE66764.1 hypothetical protein H671_8g19149 [Cricetulus griseus]